MQITDPLHFLCCTVCVGRLLGQHCGSNLPASMDTSDSFAYVRFVSDTSGNAAGFSLSFQASVEGMQQRNYYTFSVIEVKINLLLHIFLICVHRQTYSIFIQAHRDKYMYMYSLQKMLCLMSLFVLLFLSFYCSLWRRAECSLRNYLLSQLPQLVPTQPGVSLGAGGDIRPPDNTHHQ